MLSNDMRIFYLYSLCHVWKFKARAKFTSADNGVGIGSGASGGACIGLGGACIGLGGGACIGLGGGVFIGPGGGVCI